MKIAQGIFYVFLIAISVGKSYGEDIITPDHIDSLNLKAWSMVGTADAEALEISKSLLNKSQTINYENGVYNALYQMGYLYDELNYFDLSVQHYFKALFYLNDHDLINKDHKKATLMLSLGHCYEKTSRYEDALDYYQKGLNIALDNDFEKVKADLYLNLGNLYQELHDQDLALIYFLKALDAFKVQGDNTKVAKTLSLIGTAQQKRGDFLLAKEYFTEALAVSQTYFQPNRERIFYLNNLGKNYYLQSGYDSAQYFYTLALGVSKSLGDQYAFRFTSNNLGDLYLSTGKYEKAIDLFQNSIALAGEENRDAEYKRALKNISAAYEKIGNFKKAVEYKDKYIAQADMLKDTQEKLIEQNAQNRMKEVEWIMERQAKEAKIRHIEEENFWFKVSMTLLFVILAGASYMAFHYYKGIRLVKKWLASEV